MPQRFLRPGIRTSERFNSVSRDAQALYIALLTLVDDYGRYDGRPSILCAECFAIWNEQNPALAVNPQETAGFCQQLADKKLVDLYEVEGKKFVQVTQWQERARGKSRFPDPPAGIRRNPQDSAAESCLPSPSPSHRHESSPSPDGSSLRAFDKLKKRLEPIYGDRRWSNYEETMLYDISRLPDGLQELEAIIAYRESLPPKDLKFFPQSVTALLGKWTEVLDRATTQSKLNGATEHKRTKAEQAALDRHNGVKA